MTIKNATINLTTSWQVVGNGTIFLSFDRTDGALTPVPHPRGRVALGYSANATTQPTQAHTWWDADAIIVNKTTKFLWLRAVTAKGATYTARASEL